MKSTSLTEFCKIIKETAIDSAPAVQQLGAMADKLGEELGLKFVELLGESLETAARMALQTEDMAIQSNITILDGNGTRSIKDQTLAKRALKALKERNG